MRSNSKTETLGKNQPSEGRNMEVRCHCGSLIARMVTAGLELKCRRCKRQVVIPTNVKGSIRIKI